MKYAFIAFDIDGTLIDTERTGVLSLVRTVRELCGRDISYEEALTRFGLPSARVGELYDYPDLKHFGDRWEELFIELSYMIRPFPGVGEALESLSAEGYPMGVVTSRSGFEVRKDTILPAYRKWLKYLVCSDDVRRPKPYPDSLLKCISVASEDCGVEFKPSECLYVGDTRHDWECAVSAGCDFALADWKLRGSQGMDIDKRFTDIRGLLDIIRG